MLEFMDARSLAVLRRSTKVRSDIIAEEARLAELRAKVLELLETVKFPFTHAAYVLGMNGPYFSIDTLAEKHYGIPALLPSLLCRLFRLSEPNAHFTTVRIQKFSAAANFGGKHRTLAFSLASPQEENELLRAEDSDASPVLGPASNPGPAIDASRNSLSSLPGHVLCLPGPGCVGGSAEVCEEVEAAGAPAASWRLLTQPQPRACWVRFAGGAWLRWHWPRKGDLFAVTVSCESNSNCSRLFSRERCQMEAIGFHLPELAGRRDSEEELLGQACGEVEQDTEAEAEPPAQPDRAPRRRLAPAHIEAAMRVLGLTEPSPSPQEVEEAFRRGIRAAHPDRAASAAPAGASPLWSSWRMSQLTWARRILREAALDVPGESGADDGDAPPGGELLMLVPPDAPVPALMPPPEEGELDANQGAESEEDA